MAVIKVACPKCGQKVSGDDSFFGSSVECPICTSEIIFPPNPNAPHPAPAPAEPVYENLPLPPVDLTFDEADRLPIQAGHSPSSPDEYPAELPPRPDYSAMDDSLPPRADDFSPGAPVTSPVPPMLDDAPPVREAQSGSRRRNDEIDDYEDEVPSPALGATALVLGILSIISCLLTAILTAPGAIICGHIALAKAKHSPVQPAPGRTLALIGTILGYAGLVLLLIALVVLAIVGPIWAKSAGQLPA